MRTGEQDFFSQVARHSILSREEEQQLMRRVRAGDSRARETMVRHNIRLVIAIALPFQRPGIGLEDLFQDGMIGMERALTKFDPERGFKFSTYATWWIRQAIQRGVANKGDTIRLPVHVKDRQYRARRHITSNPDATDEEIADALGTDAHLVRTALSAPRASVSFDATYEDRIGWAETLPDPNAPDPAGIVAHEALVGPVRDAVEALPEPTRSVIRLRFGFDDQDPLSINEVSERLGLAGHRVSNLQREGLALLRAALEDDDGI